MKFIIGSNENMTIGDMIEEIYTYIIGPVEIEDELYVESATCSAETTSNSTLMDALKQHCTWYTNVNSCSVVIKFSKRVCFKAVSIVAVSSSSAYRSITTCILSASKDGDSYVQLASGSGGSEYLLYEDTTEYQYYKLDLTCNNYWIGFGGLFFLPYT